MFVNNGKMKEWDGFAGECCGISFGFSKKCGDTPNFFSFQFWVWERKHSWKKMDFEEKHLVLHSYLDYIKLKMERGFTICLLRHKVVEFFSKRKGSSLFAKLFLLFLNLFCWIWEEIVSKLHWIRVVLRTFGFFFLCEHFADFSLQKIHCGFGAQAWILSSVFSELSCILFWLVVWFEGFL